MTIMFSPAFFVSPRWAVSFSMDDMLSIIAPSAKMSLPPEGCGSGLVEHHRRIF